MKENKKTKIEVIFDCGRHCVNTCPEVENKCMFFNGVFGELNSRTVKVEANMTDPDALYVATNEFTGGTVTKLSDSLFRVQPKDVRYPFTVNVKTGEITYDSDIQDSIKSFEKYYAAGVVVANARRLNMPYQVTFGTAGDPIVTVEAAGGRKLVFDAATLTLDAKNFIGETCKTAIEKFLENTGLKVTSEQIKHEVKKEVNLNVG